MSPEMRISFRHACFFFTPIPALKWDISYEIYRNYNAIMRYRTVDSGNEHKRSCWKTYFRIVRKEINEGRKRIDITFHNAATEGFWHDMKTSPQYASSMMMFECKNYSCDIKNEELDQMSGRFSNVRGWFGIILCRHFDDKQQFIKRCQDTAKDGRGIIICLDDSDIVEMLHNAENGQRKKTETLLIKKYQEVIS